MKTIGRSLFVLPFLIAVVLCSHASKLMAGDSVNMVFATGFQKSHRQYGGIGIEWMDRIEKATEGRVKMRGAFGGTLLKATKTLEGLMKGTADAGPFTLGYTPGKLPLGSSLSALTDIELGNKLDMRGVSAIQMKLVEEFPEFIEEFHKLGIEPMFWIPTFPYGTFTHEPVNTIGDYKGKRMRVFGYNLPKLFEAIGATPVALAFGELYTGLQTKVVDGAITDPPAGLDIRLYEPAPNLTILGPTIGPTTALCPGVYAFNAKSFASLSEKDQEIIRKVSREMTVYAADEMTKTGMEAFDKLKEKGCSINNLPQKEVDKWAAASPDWYEDIAEDLNQRGLPGTEITERYQQLVNDYATGKWNPYE